MSAITYVVTARDDTASPPGVTGLTPTWVFLKRLSDNANVAQPSISEVGFGHYKFSFDAEALTDSTGQIDFGASLTDPAARYVDVLLARESGRIITNLDAVVGDLPDAVLTRDWAATEAAVPTSTEDRNLLQAARRWRNKVTRVPAVVYKEDDTTTAWTATLITEAEAEAVVSVDPE